MGSITLCKVVTECVGVTTGGLHCSGTFICIHLSNALTDHLNIQAYIKAWLLPNNKMKLLLLYYSELAQRALAR